MSPRCTQAFHDAGDREHLCPVGFVGFELGRFGGQGLFASMPGSCLYQGQPDGLGTGQARCFQLV